MLRTASSLLALLVLVIGVSPAWADDAPPKRAPRGRHLDLALDRYSHDFGFVKQGSVHKASFTLTNTSTETVTGIKARGECGCNVMNVEKPALAPGASCFFQVEFNTYTLGGRLKKRVRIVSSDHRRGEIVLDLHIRIQAGLVVQPGGVSFHTVRRGTTKTASFYLRRYEGHGQPFKITAISVPGYEDTFATTVKPWQSDKDPQWKGWQVDVTLRKTDLPYGTFSAEVLVRTDHPERSRVTLALSGNVVGKLYVQNRYFSFGKVKTLPWPKASSVKVKPYDADVKIVKPRATSKLGKVIVEVIPDPYMAAQGMWKLIARVAPNAPAGSLEDEVITLHTGVPGEETVEFAVRGTVSAGAKAVTTAPKADDGR